MNTPVVLIIFNRPIITQKVFDVIRKIKPPELFVISDGPRKEKGDNEEKKVLETRTIIESIDWKCNVYKKYSSTNLGCRMAVSSGLDWVFSQVDRAIILEDDCIPDLSFFPYCKDLLEQYKNNNKIAMISGDNFFPDIQIANSYDFSYHSLVWGWATWARAWKLYRSSEERGMSYFEKNYNKFKIIMSPRRLQAIRKTLQGEIDTWDYIWQYTMLLSNGFCIVPKTNLVKNIGFDSNATHTKHATFHVKLTTGEMVFPLMHPKNIRVNNTFEKQMEKTYSPFYLVIDILRQFFRL